MELGLSLFTIFIFFLVSVRGENVIVVTSKGVVVGIRVNPNPATGVSYDAFLGIPYGKVPGRFQPSAPRDAWAMPLLAQSDGPMCPQPNAQFSEDCLYLNVFTPVNSSLSSPQLPVMVYIHGGGFTYGSSSSLQYGPDFLVPQDVILVTVNYRVGAAGFMTLGTPESPGNLGLYDTMLALQWVQQEIQKFGGDPSLVTLFGHSAGSIIVSCHYISPVSSGQSGGLQGYVMPPKEAIRRAKLLSHSVGCDSSLNSSAMLDCLQRVDINTIVSKQNINLPIEDLARGETLRFIPVLDSSFAKTPFFTDSLDNLMKEANNRYKPLMTGFASADGMVKFQEEVWKLAEANLPSFIPANIRESISDSKIAKMTNQIKDEYFPVSVEQNKIMDVVDLYTDTIFAYPTVQTARALANLTYGFVYDFRGVWNPMPPYVSRFQVTGVFHGAELTYLFYSANSSQDLGQCSLNLPCLSMRDTLVGLWTTFAKYGSPQSSVSWGTVATGNYLMIGEQLSLVNRSTIEARHYQFWADLASENNSSTAALGNLLVVIVALWVLLSVGI